MTNPGSTHRGARRANRRLMTQGGELKEVTRANNVDNFGLLG